MTRSNNMVSTEMVLTSNFVKYQRLTGLVLAAFGDSNATTINLYLDLYGVMKTLFSDSYRTDISDYTALTTTILNMCGHYRSYFKGLGVHAKIYLVWSYNTPEINKKFVPDYNKSFEGKSQNNIIREMVELNCSLLDTLCPFLNDIFFLQSEYESSVMIDYLMSNRNNDGNPNLIISKDIYPAQLTYLHPNTAFIKPKKLNHEDLSMIIPPMENINFIDRFWELMCSTRGNNMTTNRGNIWIHPCNFTLFSALTRFPERSLNTITNTISANKIIFDIVGREPVKLQAESLGEINDKINIHVVSNRQKVLDIEYMRDYYKDTMEAKLIKLENFEDPDSVRALCTEYFSNNPVDLTRL